MRLFIASKAVLYDYGGIREDFAGVIEGKWVEEENLHLTWVFLGEHEDAQGFLQKLTQMPPLTHCVAIRGIGSFGHPPRLLYGRVEDSVLQERAAEFERAGFGMARFRPHVSLCRIKKIRDFQNFKKLKKAYRRRQIGHIERDISLYQSKLTPQGPIYTRIKPPLCKIDMLQYHQKTKRRSMQIQMQPMGAYQTNCYIVTIDGKDLIIDPGVGATEWVVQNVKHPVAILNTHGHFDHVWSNAELKEKLKIPIYAPKGDLFMLQSDPLGQGTPPSHADYAVEGDEALEIAGVKIRYRHFPGHTPGCSVIEIGDTWFSGDFLFQQSIGRWDFPASSGADMLKSLAKALEIEEDYTIYPGHGPHTTLKAEQRVIPFWMEQVRSTL